MRVSLKVNLDKFFYKRGKKNELKAQTAPIRCIGVRNGDRCVLLARQYPSFADLQLDHGLGSERRCADADAHAPSLARDSLRHYIFLQKERHRREDHVHGKAEGRALRPQKRLYQIDEVKGFLGRADLRFGHYLRLLDIQLRFRLDILQYSALFRLQSLRKPLSPPHLGEEYAYSL